MAATLHYFMLPDDERSLFRHLARRELTIYPELVPPGYAPARFAGPYRQTPNSFPL